MMIIDLIFSEGEVWQKLVKFVAFALAVVVALTVHEYSHARMAVRWGDQTPKIKGRLSLNPGKHFDTMGLFAFIFIGFGWAKPMPVNPFNFTNYRKGNFWVSMAGCISNLVIGVTASLLFVISVLIFEGAALFIFTNIFWFLMLINFSLMVFNLMPIPPLDGFNMLNSFTKPDSKFMAFMRQYGMIILLVVLVTGAASDVIFTILNFIVNNLVWFWSWIFGVL